MTLFHWPREQRLVVELDAPELELLVLFDARRGPRSSVLARQPERAAAALGGDGAGVGVW